METNVKTEITVQANVKASLEDVWKKWNDPNDIVKWATGSPDWHTPRAENDLRKGGRFRTRMEAKDGSAGFDFLGVYDAVEKYKYIEYTIDDGRKVKINFTVNGDTVNIVETFEAENENPIDMQRGGWQTIMDNFKSYAESK